MDIRCSVCSKLLTVDSSNSWAATITDSKTITPRPLSKSATNLDEADFDLPLCEECGNRAIKNLRKQQMHWEGVLVKYTAYCAQLDAQEKDKPTVDTLADQVVDLQEQEKQLIHKLHLLKEDHKTLSAQLEQLRMETLKLEEMEERHRQNVNTLEVQVVSFKEEKDAVAAKLQASNEFLMKLKRTDLLNDCFHVWHDGHFGTISTFRLGRLPPSQPVDWTEINAACGQAVMLLNAIAKKIPGFQFSTYRLLPMGSFSKLEKISDKSPYNLHSYGDIWLSFLPFKTFDTAMGAFVSCVKEVATFVEKQDSTFKLPYKIDKDKIGDVSIKMGNDDTWTRAMKFLLTDIKWLLAWATKNC